MKVKLTTSDASNVFEYLDKNKDGFVNYAEFCHLCEEKRRNIDPFDHLKNKTTAQTSIMEEEYEDMEQIERMSNASQFYKGFKSNKLKNKINLNHRTPGINAPHHTNSAQLHTTFGV